MMTLSEVDELNEVFTGVPPTVTVESPLNPAPLNVTVTGVSCNVTGAIGESVGFGLLIVKLLPVAGPPPGEGFVAPIVRDPACARNGELIVAVSCTGELNVVGIGVPPTVT
jgi:hypothetical protein